MSGEEKLPIIIKNPKLTNIEIFGVELVKYNNEYNHLIKSNNIKEIINNLRADYLNKQVIIATLPEIENNLTVKTFESKKNLGSFILDIGFLNSVERFNPNRQTGYVFISFCSSAEQPDLINFSNIEIKTYLEDPRLV